MLSSVWDVVLADTGQDKIKNLTSSMDHRPQMIVEKDTELGKTNRIEQPMVYS